MSKATQGEACTAVEEDRKRATMVGNDSVNIVKEGGGNGGEWRWEVERNTTGYATIFRSWLFATSLPRRKQSEVNNQETCYSKKCPYNRKAKVEKECIG